MPHPFGIEHIIFLIIYLLVTISILIIISKYCKTTKSQELVITIHGLLLLTTIIFNRVSIAVGSGEIVDLIPNSFCGLTSLLLALFTLYLKDKNHPIFHFIIYHALIGGVIATIYPTYLDQADSIFYSKTISGLLHHVFAINMALIIIVTKRFKPDLKRWYCFSLGLVCYITYGLFLIDFFELSDAMNIYTPLIADSFLTWYFSIIMMSIFQVIFLIIYQYCLNRQKK